MLDVIRFSQILHVFIYERDPIVTDQPPGDPKPYNDRLSYEVCHDYSSGIFQMDTFTHFVKYSVAARIHM